MGGNGAQCPVGSSAARRRAALRPILTAISRRRGGYGADSSRTNQAGRQAGRPSRLTRPMQGAAVSAARWEGGTMGASRLRRLSPRGELVLVLVLGLAGAGLVFLAVRQGWAHVRTAAPRPLPGSDVPVTGQDLVPAAGALAVAALASLAAVLATRGLARRLVGLLLAGFGAGIAVAVSAGITAADAIAAAAGNAGSAGSAGSAGT